MILTALGWLAALGLLGACLSSAWHGIREKARGPWIGAGLYACAAVVLLAVDGVLKPLSAGVLAFLALAAATAVALAEGPAAAPDSRWKGAAWRARFAVGSGARYLGADTRGIWRRIAERLHGGEDEPTETETEAVVAEHVTTRNIPSVMADPVLGLAPEPAALATAAPVPPPYAVLASFIGGFVPEDDQALKMFMQSNAAGECAIADAWHAFADICLSGVGLDPAYVAGLLEAGDSAAQHASLLAMVHKRFGVVYAAVQEWISAGRQLPHKARDFLTGEAA
jgi:hypothetical protein